MLSFYQKYFFNILAQIVQCIPFVHATYRCIPEKIGEGVEFLIQPLSKQYVELKRAVTRK